MLYPLSSVHKLIYETIHPEAISQIHQSHFLTDTRKELERKIEESRLHLFSQLSQASGTDSLKVIVYTCQAGYISLINRLGLYITQACQRSPGNETAPSIQHHYIEIRRLLIQHLNDLYQHYHPFFDPEQYVPRFILTNKQYRIKNKLGNIRSQLTSLCVDESLLCIVCFPFEQLINGSQPKLTYKQLHYTGLFFAELETYCSLPATSEYLFTLPDFLIKMNFNEPRFINYLIKQLREQLTDDMSLQEHAEKWAFHVKEFKQLTVATSYSLYPQRQAARDSLIKIAEQELHFVKQKMLLLSSGTRAALPDKKEKADVITHLTVSQLGVFTRLLVDCKLIQPSSQAELLRVIAGCIKTTKTTQISAESLRVRYYNPDKASIAITKEYLLRMLKQLNEY